MNDNNTQPTHQLQLPAAAFSSTSKSSTDSCDNPSENQCFAAQLAFQTDISNFPRLFFCPSQFFSSPSSQSERAQFTSSIFFLQPFPFTRFTPRKCRLKKYLE
jgi:hypothetical protein